jgi:glutaryl-CoA transferase
VREREMVVHVPHPKRAAMPMLANPIRLSGTPVQYRMPPPGLGEHTDDVLSELLGYDEAKRHALREQGVI